MVREWVSKRQTAMVWWRQRWQQQRRGRRSSWHTRAIQHHYFWVTRAKGNGSQKTWLTEKKRVVRQRIPDRFIGCLNQKPVRNRKIVCTQSTVFRSSGSRYNGDWSLLFTYNVSLVRIFVVLPYEFRSFIMRVDLNSERERESEGGRVSPYQEMPHNYFVCFGESDFRLLLLYICENAVADCTHSLTLCRSFATLFGSCVCRFNFNVFVRNLVKS